MGWNRNDVGDQTGRSVVITGANSGIGLETARVLAAKGAQVILGCRDVGRGESAAATLSGPVPALVRHLDLADLDSVRAFADATTEPVTDLVDNAGIMACPAGLSAQGYELQMGTNHLGHALLTALLWPRLRERPGARVVVITSTMARFGRLSAATTTEDLIAPTPYRAQRVYGNTKQANLLFVQELSRRAAGSGVVAVAAHPGGSATELFYRQLRDNGLGVLVPVVRLVVPLVMQSSAAGALPTLRALTDPALHGGELIAPGGPFQARGAPHQVEVFASGRDRATAERLWSLTGDILATPLPG